MNKDFKWAIGATIVWVIGIVVLQVYLGNSFSKMAPNEWGDFLAGLMAPPAFLWFVLAYLQQSKELRLNTEALRLQERELRNQVEETKALVEQTALQAKAAADRLDLEREQMAKNERERQKRAQPVFQYKGGQGGIPGATLTFHNIGGEAFSPKILLPGSCAATMHPSDCVGRNQEGWIKIKGPITSLPLDFSISYVDGLGNKGVQEFQYFEHGKFRKKGGAA